MGLWKERAPEIQSLLDSNKTLAEIAAHFGVSRKSIRNRIAELRAAGVITGAEPDNYKASLDIGKDGAYTSDKPLWMTLEQVKDPEYLLRAHGFEPDAWELVSAKNNIWNTNDKVHGIQTLYSSKITVKPKVNEYDEEKMMAFFERLASTYQSPVRQPSHYSTDGKLLELNIADLHIGKLAWFGDTGDTYNHEIARERFFYIINDVLNKTQHYNFERILFVWCNDYFHIDGPGKMTTKGTPQDASMQFEHMFEFGAEMLVQAMDLLTQVAPITTLYTASNHDRLVSFFATKYLDAWYRNNKHVTVDSRPLSRKAVRFGANLTGFTHGHFEQKRMGTWMSVDYAKDWGEVLFREVHAAHIHSQRAIIEENGQTTRFMSSPTGTDRYHHNHAWTGAIERAQSFVYDREMGIENVFQSTIPIKGKRVESIVI